MSMAKLAFTVADIPELDGLRYLITGANSGIGYMTALELLRHGADVLMACRDMQKGESAIARLKQTLGAEAAARATLVQLDMASLANIQSVANDLVAEHLPLHGLINNAGVFAPPKRLETRDGFEVQFGTNVLGHFALTCRLMPALAMAGASLPEERGRVVTVASIAHKKGKLDFDDLQRAKNYNGMEAYYQSKLADLMFTFALERRLRARHQPVISVAVHPGVAQSALFKVGSGKGLAGVAERVISGSVGLFLNDDAQGALPTLFGATADQAEPGGYYGPQGLNEMRGGDVGDAQVAPQARDVEAQERLWAVCAGLTGVDL